MEVAKKDNIHTAEQNKESIWPTPDFHKPSYLQSMYQSFCSEHADFINHKLLCICYFLSHPDFMSLGIVVHLIITTPRDSCS